MSDLEHQLRAYAKELDASAPPVEDLVPEIAESDDDATVVPLSRRTPTWTVILGAAAVVIVAIGSVAILASMRESTVQVATTPSSSEPDPNTPVASVTTTPPPPIEQSRYAKLVSEVPLYSGGEGGDVGTLPLVGAGQVVLSDDVSHMLFAAGGEDDVWENVFHATSTNGSAWAVDPAPVTMSGVEGAADLDIGSVDVLADGTWVMYYGIAFDVGGHGNHIYEHAIRRATATSPTGPWTTDPEPMLLPGDEGTWDAAAVKSPSVIRQGDAWLMFYAGHGYEPKDGEAPPPGMVGASALGLATSQDGITWIKRSEPVFVGRSDLPWEGGAVARTSVVWDGDRYLVVYAGRTGGSRGLATSADGVEWQRVSEQPILTAVDLPRPTILSASLYVDGDGAGLYVSNGGYRTTSAVYDVALDVP